VSPQVCTEPRASRRLNLERGEAGH
jgi:hypothetical protein